jgi:nitrate reductase gamma subunit
METFLWGVFPYIVALVFVGGLVWRYRYDQFGWTTRSSQLYESRLLKFASPLFHFALLAVFLGHVVGLIIPKALTDWIGTCTTWAPSTAAAWRASRSSSASRC